MAPLPHGPETTSGTAFADFAERQETETAGGSCDRVGGVSDILVQGPSPVGHEIIALGEADLTGPWPNAQ